MNIFNKYLIYFLLILIIILFFINFKLKENFFINKVYNNCPARIKYNLEKCIDNQIPENGDKGNIGRKGRKGITGNTGDTGIEGKKGKDHYKLGFIKFYDNLTKSLISIFHSPNFHTYYDKITNINILRGDDGNNAFMIPIDFKDKDSNTIIKKCRALCS